MAVFHQDEQHEHILVRLIHHERHKHLTIGNVYACIHCCIGIGFHGWLHRPA